MPEMMSGGIDIGEIRTDFTADLSGLEAGVVRAPQLIANATDKMNSNLSRTGEAANAARVHTDSLGLSLQVLGAGALKAGLALEGLAAGFGLLLHNAEQLEVHLSQVAANTGMSQQQFEAMRATVLSLGATSDKSFTDIANAYMRVVNHGYEAADATNILRAALQGATATGASTETVANALSVVLHDFHIPASNATQVLNALAEAANKGNMTLGDLVGASGKMMSAASGLHVSLQDVLAAFSALTSTGKPASMAANEITSAMVKMANPTAQAVKEIEKLKAVGIDVSADFGRFGEGARTFAERIEDLHNKLGGSTEEILKLLNAQRGGLAVMALASQSFEDYKTRIDLVSQALDGELTPIQEAYGRATETLAFQLGTLQNKFQLMGIELYAAVGPQTVGMLETFNNTVLKMIGFLDSLPDSAKKATVAFVATIAVVGSMSLAFGALAVLLGGPVAAAIIGLGLVFAAWAAMVTTDLGNVMEAFRAWFGGTKVTFSGAAGVVGAFLDAFLVLSRGVIMAVDAMITGVVALGSAFKQAMPALIGFGTAAVGALTGNIGQVISGVDQMKNAVMAGVKTIADQGFLLKMRLDASMSASAGNLAGYWENKFKEGVAKAGQWADNLTKIAAGARDKYNAMQQQMADATDKIPDAMGKTGKKMKDNSDKLLQDQLSLVNEYLQSTGSALRFNEDVWKAMGQDIRAEWLALATAWKKITDQMSLDAAKLQIALVRAAKATGQAVDETLAVDIKNGHLVVHETFQKIQAESADLGTGIALLAEGFDLNGEKIDAALGRMATSAAHRVDQEQKAYERSQANLEKYNQNLIKTFEDLSRRLPDSWNSVIDAILNGSGRAGMELVKFGINVKGWANDILRVVTTMPGAFGDAARGVLRTVDDWMRWGDAILSLMNRFDKNIPASIGELVKKITGMFHKTNEEVHDAAVQIGDEFDTINLNAEKSAKSISTSMNTGATGIEGSAGRVVGALSQMAGAALAFVGARGQGFLGGAVSGALGGLMAAGGIAQLFSVALSPLTMGLSALAGGIIGGIAGLFGGGKSQAQKDIEKQAAEQSRLNIEKTKVDIQSAVEDVMSKGFDILVKLEDFTAVPRKSITRFFNQLGDILHAFLDMSFEFKDEALTTAKAVAENLGASFDMMINAATLIEAMRGLRFVTDTVIAQFMDFIKKTEAGWEAVADEIDTGMSKRSAKIAGKLSTSFEFLRAIPDTINAILSTPDFSEIDVQKPFEEAKVIMDEFFAYADEFQGYALTATAKTATKLKTVYEGGTALFDFLKALADYTPLTGVDFTGPFTIAKTFITDYSKFMDDLESYAIDVLAKSSDKVNSVLGAGKTIFDFLKALADYKPGVEAIDMSGAFVAAKNFITQYGVFLDQFTTWSLNVLAKGAEKMKPIMDAGKSLFDFVKSLGEYKTVDVGQLNNVTNDFVRVLDWEDHLIALAQQGLDKAITLSSLVTQLGGSLVGSITAMFNLAPSGGTQAGPVPGTVAASAVGGGGPVVNYYYTTNNNVQPGAFTVDLSKIRTVQDLLNELQGLLQSTGGLAQAASSA